MLYPSNSTFSCPSCIFVSCKQKISASKFLNISFIQEVVSCKRAVEKYIPQTDVVIELGGEDAKIIYFVYFIRINILF